MQIISPPLIGHSLLDAEHESLQDFANLCNEICLSAQSENNHAICNNGNPVPSYNVIKRGFIHFLPTLRSHIKNEENVMHQLDWVEINPVQMAFHLGAHQQLLSTFCGVITQLLNDSANKRVFSHAMRLHELITIDLHDHIHQHDVKFIPYLTMIEHSVSQ